MAGELVLVTGGSGFVAAHCLLRLLDQGYRVRTTVRSLTRESDVRAMLAAGGATHADQVTFVAADLSSDHGWPEAVAGCDYVLHVASPFPPSQPKNEDELIIPARDGALRVLRAARDAGVKRVVLTSSFAAIGYGHANQDQTFDETTWTDLQGNVSAYVKSKTLAERAAWDFVAREGNGLELSVINPVGVMGPVLGPDYATSVRLVAQILNGALPALPDLAFGIVDVRDVADLHLLAMTRPEAKGERFLATAGLMTAMEVAALLRARLGDVARRVPTRTAPNWLVRVLALVSPDAANNLPNLGLRRNATSAKAQRLLGWQPRSKEEAVMATAESLLKFGLVKGATPQPA
jgi:nucleoside-diphosphate-sugar epimerase